MSTYAWLREFAGSWMLVGMFAVYVVAVLWAFRPGTRRLHRDIADIPFRHEDTPARGNEEVRP
ncbi:MAG: cbb3-type cytochrome c oxidase subunit 3 [Rhodobacteraceae bacterium]|jgi:cytochrome c oxidase cbb3-type subunit 4|nr:cbb3-type cytochrome c oxidase subunit 3 [Paracoccaceae bacterium]